MCCESYVVRKGQVNESRGVGSSSRGQLLINLYYTQNPESTPLYRRSTTRKLTHYPTAAPPMHTFLLAKINQDIHSHLVTSDLAPRSRVVR